MKPVRRTTRETEVEAGVGSSDGPSQVATGIPFLDHLLVTLGRYAGLRIRVAARGDLMHHVVEDVAITLGAAVGAYLPRSRARYGERTVPMDDALVQCALDLGGRPYYHGPLPSSLYDHWMRSFSDNVPATIHIRVLRGSDRHHVVEAAFKALGLALRDALELRDEILSTKGPTRFEPGGH